MSEEQISLQPIDAITNQDADRLAAILNQDAALRRWLGAQSAAPLTREEFLHTAAQWQAEKHAQTFVIYAQKAVGTISISHIRPDGTARIGYWIASQAWGQGIGGEAFAQALAKARAMGLHQVSATIQAENIASLRIWRRWGAAEEELPAGQVRVVLDI